METLLNPLEELALNIIREEWEDNKAKLNITELKQKLEEKGYSLSHEKVRLIVEELWRKGEILIDVKGRERIVRPNHVTVNSRTKPVEFRNFTILDDEGKPAQRIWVSVYKDEKDRTYFTISESRWNGTWKTTSNIIIPPEAKEEFKSIIKFLEARIKDNKPSVRN